MDDFLEHGSQAASRQGAYTALYFLTVWMLIVLFGFYALLNLIVDHRRERRGRLVAYSSTFRR